MQHFRCQCANTGHISNDTAAVLSSGEKPKGGTGGILGVMFSVPLRRALVIDTDLPYPEGRAAAEVLAQQDGIRVMVIGDIGELGASAAQQHYMLGRDLVSVKGINFVVAVGGFAPAVQEGARSTQYGKKLQAFLTQEQALPLLISLAETHQPQSMSFLFKGSRFTHMETLMADLMEKI